MQPTVSRQNAAMTQEVIGVAYGRVLAFLGQGVGGGVARRGDGQSVGGPLVSGTGGEGVTGGRDQVRGIHGRFPFGQA